MIYIHLQSVKPPITLVALSAVRSYQKSAQQHTIIAFGGGHTSKDRARHIPFILGSYYHHASVKPHHKPDILDSYLLAPLVGCKDQDASISQAPPQSSEAEPIPRQPNTSPRRTTNRTPCLEGGSYSLQSRICDALVRVEHITDVDGLDPVHRPAIGPTKRRFQAAAVERAGGRCSESVYALMRRIGVWSHQTRDLEAIVF